MKRGYYTMSTRANVHLLNVCEPVILYSNVSRDKFLIEIEREIGKKKKQYIQSPSHSIK